MKPLGKVELKGLKIDLRTMSFFHFIWAKISVFIVCIHYVNIVFLIEK